MVLLVTNTDSLKGVIVPSTVQSDAHVVTLNRLVICSQLFRLLRSLAVVLLNVRDDLVVLHAGAWDQGIRVLSSGNDLRWLLREDRLHRGLLKVLVRPILRAIEGRLLVCRNENNNK